jgi:type III secretion system FlhB-like substrate exporter
VIKTVISLLVVAAVLNAVGRSTMAAWRYFQLKDEAQQLVLFGAAVSTGELASRIVEKAEELEVPLLADAVTVERDGNRTTMDAWYTEPLELFPRFVYPVDLSFSVEALAVRPATVDDVRGL